ncbi:12697_t:CDS:2 [Funneliformis geosporum]|nr:12697_t:CDS:2 [Funneliformis geosporum]
MYDATGDATTFLLTVMVPLLAITLFETKRQKNKNVRTVLDDFIIYVSLLTPTGFFYFYIIKDDITHTKIIGILIALVPAMVILAFEILYIMKENLFRRSKRCWSTIYAFLFVANVLAVGFVYASEIVSNIRQINPYFLAPICEGPFKSFRCGLSSILLTTALGHRYVNACSGVAIEQ